MAAQSRLSDPALLVAGEFLFRAAHLRPLPVGVGVLTRAQDNARAFERGLHGIRGSAVQAKDERLLRRSETIRCNQCGGRKVTIFTPTGRSLDDEKPADRHLQRQWSARAAAQPA